MPQNGISSNLARTRSRLAVATRARDPQAISAAKRDHAAEKIADCIRRTVESAPPLTDAQLDRLALLLRPVATEGVAA